MTNLYSSLINKMNEPKFIPRGKNRRLLIITAFLLLDIHSEPSSSILPFISLEDALNRGTSASRNVESGNILWLVDNHSGQCLGLHGLGSCGDATLWKTHKKSSGHVKFEAIISHIHDTTELNAKSICLGRNEKFGIPRYIEPLDCNQNVFKQKLTSWQYDNENGKIFTKSWQEHPHCLYHHPEFNQIQLIPCHEQYTSFYPMIFNTYDDLPSSLTSVTSSSPSLEGFDDDEDMQPFTGDTWICPQTGLILPTKLKLSDDHTSNSIQELMGANVFIKTYVVKFKVYTVAWYIDKSIASTDPTLKPFSGQSSVQLSNSEAFYDALISTKAQYDRSIFFKLAMTLNTVDVFTGMVQDLALKPDNAAIMASLLQTYKNEKCPRGMEIIFTWRSLLDHLEIRMDGKIFATVKKTGLAQDFFSKYVNNDPISPEAKVSFCDQFPRMLRSSSQLSTTSSTLVTTTATATSSTSSSTTTSSCIDSDNKKSSIQVDCITKSSSQSKGDNSLSTSSKVPDTTTPTTTTTTTTTTISSLASLAFILPHLEEGQQFIKPALTSPTLTPSQKVKQYIQSLRSHDYYNHQTEYITRTCIFIYVIILMMVSLPPARNIVKSVKKHAHRAKSILHNAQNKLSLIRRSLSYENGLLLDGGRRRRSMTVNLATMRRASTSALMKEMYHTPTRSTSNSNINNTINSNYSHDMSSSSSSITSDQHDDCHWSFNHITPTTTPTTTPISTPTTTPTKSNPHHYHHHNIHVHPTDYYANRLEQIAEESTVWNTQNSTTLTPIRLSTSTRMIRKSKLHVKKSLSNSCIVAMR